MREKLHNYVPNYFKCSTVNQANKKTLNKNTHNKNGK